MTDKIREHVCPNCGAPLGIPEKHERYFKCQFCGTILEDRASKEEQETGVFNIKISREVIDAARAARIPVYSSPPVITSYTPSAPSVNTANRIGCIITAVILLFVGGIIFLSVAPVLLATGAVAKLMSDLGLDGFAEDVGLDPIISNSGLGGVTLYSYGPVAMLPSDDDTSPDIVGVASGAESKTYFTYVDFEHTPALRWILEVSGDDITYSYNQFVADGTRVYLSYANKLVAYNRLQGAVVWETTLADEIQHNICPGCFQMIGGSLVTLSTDGTLAAWDAATGSSVWQFRLNATPRQIVNFGGNPGVFDDDGDGDTSFNVFSITDGSRIQQVFPACPNEPFPDSPQGVHFYDTMLPTPDGVIFFGGIFDPGCAMLWRPGQASYAWQATFDADLIRNISIEETILTAGTLYIARDGGAYAINLADGSFRVLVQNEDYDFMPLAERDGVLVLAADRTRGTRRWEIWGVDAQLGNVKWTFIPEAAARFEYLSHPLNEDGSWTAGLTSGGLTVAQLYDETPRVVLQTIPLQSGTASSPLTYNFSNDSGGFWTSILGWRNDEFWVMGDAQVFVVDATTGSAVSVWP